MNFNKSQWLPIAGFILVMMVLQWIGPDLFRYETRLILDAEFWRLFTGHWVHANWKHYVLNMVGLVLCKSLTDIAWKDWQWLWRILLLSFGISIIFYYFHSDIGWYVGFSGVLFGLYVMAAAETLSKQPVMSSILLTAVLLKITLDQWSSVKMTSTDLIGVPVLVESHLYGVLIAIIVLIFQAVIRTIRVKHTGNT